VNALVGSALADVCKQTAERIQRHKLRLADGTAIGLRCRAMGSGDVVTELVEIARSVKNGTRPADDPTIPTLVSLDGDLEQDQLRYLVQQIAPNGNWIPATTDSPAFASSPMVLMTTADLAEGLRDLQDPYTALTTASSHRDLGAGSADLPIRFVHTAPTRSNSGLQTLVAQFVAVSGKPAERLTLDDVRENTAKVRAIQNKITRYGASTGELAKAMVRNGPFWASIASVYESSVVASNKNRPPGQAPYVAIYPKATFTSTMRLILPSAPWVSEREREAVQVLSRFMLERPVQELVAGIGLRPANPAVEASQILISNGVDPQARYDALRSPKPEVVQAMIQAWLDVAKKPSRVALVVDSSGSMEGAKISAVQASLMSYLSQIGSNDTIALIDFDNRIQPPVVVDGSTAGKQLGQAFLASLKADGGTHLHDAVLAGRDWLKQTGQRDEIRAVVVLTDGRDRDSATSLQALQRELRSTGFESDDRIAVFSVGYGEAGTFDASTLKALAEGNGGEYLQGSPDTIRTLLNNLQLSF
jgi:Ca-activated chloride channel family protein